MSLAKENKNKKGIYWTNEMIQKEEKIKTAGT